MAFTITNKLLMERIFGCLMFIDIEFRHIKSIAKINLEDSSSLIIFKHLQKIYFEGKPFDILTLIESLQELDELEEAGGEVYLFNLVNNIPHKNITEKTFRSYLIVAQDFYSRKKK